MKRALVPTGFLAAVAALMTAEIDDPSAIGTALALVRVGALVLAGWLALVSTVAVLARGTAVGALATRAMPVAVLVALGAPPSGAQEQPGTATMSVLPEQTTTTIVQQQPSPTPSPAVPAADEWLVEPGDSFWSIAEAIVGERLGYAPSDDEVDPYWRRLVDANRDRIISGDADVIRPGQRFALPPA